MILNPYGILYKDCFFIPAASWVKRQIYLTIDAMKKFHTFIHITYFRGDSCKYMCRGGIRTLDAVLTWVLRIQRVTQCFPSLYKSNNNNLQVSVKKCRQYFCSSSSILIIGSKIAVDIIIIMSVVSAHAYTCILTSNVSSKIYEYYFSVLLIFFSIRSL